jgi:anaerobic selenocysteine-containing dehydrogenase
MNRQGAALMGEAQSPPIRSLFVFGANPATSTVNAGLIAQGMKRDDLFTVVHDLFMTDTAGLADLVLPATSQLEQTDLHKSYGHSMLTYNAQAIEPLGESRSNWDLMRSLARAMGLTEPWLRQSPDEVIEEVLAATGANDPHFAGINLERVKNAAFVPLSLSSTTPFVGGTFPTPSGKLELFSESLERKGVDPLPGRFREELDDGGLNGEARQEDALTLVTGAAHHFVSSSFAGQKGLLEKAGTPFVEIHPEDAGRRSISDGDMVILSNGRGQCRLRAVVTDAVRPGVVVSPKGRWGRLSGGRNVNWLTTDTLADMAGQSAYHSTRIWLRRDY